MPLARRSCRRLCPLGLPSPRGTKREICTQPTLHARFPKRRAMERRGAQAVTLHGGCSRLGWKVVLCVRQCFHEAKVRRLIIKADHQEVERQMDTPGCAWECAVFSDSRVACGRQTSVCGSCSTCWCGARVHIQRSWRTRLSPTIVKRLTSPLAMSALTSGEVSEVAYWPDNVSTRRDSSTAGVRCQLELHCSPFSKSAPVGKGNLSIILTQKGGRVPAGCGPPGRREEIDPLFRFSDREGFELSELELEIQQFLTRTTAFR